MSTHLAQTFLIEVMSIALPLASSIGSKKAPSALYLLNFFVCCSFDAGSGHLLLSSAHISRGGQPPPEPCAKAVVTEMLENELCGKTTAGGT